MRKIICCLALALLGWPAWAQLGGTAKVGGTASFGGGGTPAVALPAFDNDSGAYTNDAAVTITDSTSGATICYTTNGTDPAAVSAGTCSTGTAYTVPLNITATGTNLKAIGTKAGSVNSSIKSATYTLQAATPTASPAAGAVANPTTVTWASTTTGTVTFHYTTDGVTSPTCSTGTTGSSVSVTTATTYKVVACKANYTDSAVLTAAYTIGGAPSYLLSEDFEGSNQCTGDGSTNPNSCTSAANSFSVFQSPTTDDFGYTTSPLEGTKSLRISGAGGVFSTAGLSSGTHLYGFFEFVPVSASFTADFFDVVDSTLAIQMIGLNVSGGNLHDYDTTDRSSSFAITAGTKYYIWWEWQSGTGANGVAKIYASTTTTKPGTPTISVTNSSITATANYTIWLTTGTQEGKFDHIRLSSSDITVYP